MTVAYVDASAIVKLIVAEAESEALVLSLGGYDAYVTSVIAQVEVPRVVRRTGLDPDLVVTNDVLSRFATVVLDRSVIDIARDIDPARIRTLDAIHLASAISLGIEDLVFVAYDERCLEGAGHAGLATSSPRSIDGLREDCRPSVDGGAEGSVPGLAQLEVHGVDLGNRPSRPVSSRSSR